MKKNEFENYKQHLIAKLKEKNACQPEFKRILSSKNMEDIQRVLGYNFEWCVKNKIDTSLVKIVNTDVDLRGCNLKGITLPTSIGGYLDLRGCYLKGITLPTSIGGYLDLRGCDLKGITLPTSIGGSLDLSGCDLKGITLPDKLKQQVIK